MTQIKICGLKTKEDILYANRLKPDYVGFVFAKSSREVTLSRAKELIKELDENIKKVGVFLNAPTSKVNKIASDCQLDVLQFHGDENPLYCNSFNLQVWKAFRIKDLDDLNLFKNYYVSGLLLDTYVKGEYGGTGKSFHWEIAKDIGKHQFVILAGGLTSENVAEAIQMIHPKIVDVSSGVETNGQKDFEKMRNFIENVRKPNE